MKMEVKGCFSGRLKPSRTVRMKSRRGQAEKSHPQNFRNWKLDEPGITDTEIRYQISKN